MIVFDLDGTLSIVGDRVKYLEGTNKDYNSFYDACDEDLANTPIIKILRNFVFRGDRFKIVTGRSDRVRKKTIEWLERNQIISDCSIFDFEGDLIMRKDSDHRPDTIVKPELVKDFIGDIEMIFEDRNSMVKKWRELGLTCLQVAEGDF